MGTGTPRARGREAYARQSWGEAVAALSAADAQEPLTVDDLERLAIAAFLNGREDASLAALERAHRRLLADGQVARAVRWAFWIALTSAQRGQHAVAGGWLARAERLLHDAALDCVERGYLRVPAGLHALGSGEAGTALATFEEVLATAVRFSDPDLAALGRLGCGQALVAKGEPVDGVARLDEAMLAVTSGDVSPMVAGIVYCAVIITCRKIFDLRRAQEWTTALSRWCASQEGLQPYRGQCLIHRSEILQLRGEWSDALGEVEQACEHLGGIPGNPVLGMARYQQAELLRLRGELDEAEIAYRGASEWGHPVQPGLALLRLAQGRIEDATAAARRVVDATAGDRVERSRVLAAFVEIMLAVDDVDSARSAADELSEIARDFAAPYLEAVAATARGAVMLAERDASAAADALRDALSVWQELDAPYESARVRVLTARACRLLGDEDTATLELDAAGHVFEQLGAAPASAEVAELSRSASDATPGSLTPREVEVLSLLATGATNRQIAETLVISEKTVARHLSNLYTKIGVSTRAAATAWGYQQDLV